MESVYVPKSPHEKAMQRALIQYRNPKNYDLVKEALIKAHREDLIGNGPKCLIREGIYYGKKEKSGKKDTSYKKNVREKGASNNKITKKTVKKKTIRKVHKKKNSSIS